MVTIQTINTYICDWPGCNKSYSIRSDATNCEAQGLEELIQPGFMIVEKNAVSKEAKRIQIILNEKSLHGHERTYEIITLSGIGSTSPKSDNVGMYNLEWLFAVVNINQYSISSNSDILEVQNDFRQILQMPKIPNHGTIFLETLRNPDKLHNRIPSSIKRKYKLN